MTSWWRTVSENYHDLMENRSDQRLKNWFMMSGPLPTVIVCISYIYIVKVIGPKLMEKRKPFILRQFMMYYNLFQVLLSALIFYRILKYGWWNDYSLRCQPVDYSNNPKAIGMVETCWLYYMSKFSELIDTIVFVLRKKNNQVSILHVYHHASMPIIVWTGLKFVPGGHSTFFGLLNTFVHVIMYGYYFLAAFGPKMQPYLWWKKYLTLLQLIQFVLAIMHAGQLIFIECDYPKIFLLIGIPHGVLLLYLFGKFYYKSYNKKKVE